MARLVHLSDLHFGAHDDRLVKAVEREVDQLKPDLVVISGDFTQRARTEQFSEACQFLGQLRDHGHAPGPSSSARPASSSGNCAITGMRCSACRAITTYRSTMCCGASCHR